MLEWSDDDEAPTVPSPSTKEPPRNKRASRSEDAPELATEEVPEQQAEQQAQAGPKHWMEENPGQQAEQRPTVEETRHPP